MSLGSYQIKVKVMMCCCFTKCSIRCLRVQPRWSLHCSITAVDVMNISRLCRVCPSLYAALFHVMSDIYIMHVTPTYILHIYEHKCILFWPASLVHCIHSDKISPIELFYH